MELIEECERCVEKEDAQVKFMYSLGKCEVSLLVVSEKERRGWTVSLGNTTRHFKSCCLEIVSLHLLLPLGKSDRCAQRNPVPR